MQPFVVQQRVEYADTDMAGIVHFTQFHQYMEAAEHALFRHFNLSINHRLENGLILGWPRVSCSFDFFRPLRFEDEFSVSLWIARLGKKSVTYEADIVKDGTVVAHGQSTSVCCLVDPASCRAPKSMDIPDWIHANLTPFVKPPESKP